jgi:hypothetical protein
VVNAEGWLRGTPAAPGVYERRLVGEEEHHYARWTGDEWLRAAATPELAERQTAPSLFAPGDFSFYRPVTGVEA